MFTKVRLRNFRSFDTIDFDLTEKNNTPKSLAIVFGENGAGKSNLMSSFVLLNELLATMDVRDAYEDFLSRKAIFFDENMEKAMRQRIHDELRDIRAIIDDCRMVGSNDPIVAEFEFRIGDNNGKYLVELGTDEIIHERLEYLLNKRRGTYFDCSETGIIINNGIVKNKELLADIKASAKRFWGKHSLLAIITHELHDKSKAYGHANISENFNDVMAEIGLLSCNVKIGAKYWDHICTPLSVLAAPIQGSISVAKEKQLEIAEVVLTTFFSAINSDIKRVFYKKRSSEKHVDYELFFEKMIAGEYRSIDFSKESTGNHQLLRCLCYLLTACIGGTVVIDEADSGVHDVLFSKILQEIAPFVDGQIIMTTHNSMLMEAPFSHVATYILDEKENGKKQIKSISDYKKRTFYNNNIRNKYLNNEYGGIPTVTKIDFKKLLDEIEVITCEN